MLIRSSSEKQRVICNPEEQRPSLLKPVIEKTVRDLLEWYPPFFLHSHPEVRTALSELFPSMKAALEIEKQIFDKMLAVVQK